MTSSLEEMRNKALLMVLNSTSMTPLVHKVHYLHPFGGLIGAAWCSCAVISLGANYSTLLTQNMINF